MKLPHLVFAGLRPPPVRLAAVAALAAALLSGPAHGRMSVFDSPHNLSASGGRNRTSGRPGVVFSEEQQVCIFCHVPHNAQPGTPLWSRALPAESTNYRLYNESTTLNASPKPDKPTGGSRLCLSCHDGTIALNKYTRSPITSDKFMPADQDLSLGAAKNASINANLTTDLRDDHPFSFLYTEALAQKSHLVSPSLLPAQIRLEGGSLECTACHDPHDNQYGNFLVLNNGSDDPTKSNYMTGSPLCTSCHQPEEWNYSTHNNKAKPSLGHECLNCHVVHNAPGALRLLGYPKPEANCLSSCHDSSADAASSNVKPLFGLNMYRHPVDSHNPAPGMDHDEKESLPAQNYHVQCVDCHNPHQVSAADAPLSAPPRIDGRLKGVRKDILGSLATTEYDICFKCHAGAFAPKFSGVTEIMPNRVIADPDQMERFDIRNPSFHPVTADRRTAGASLITELQPVMTRIYCTDCHNSDQSAKAMSGQGTKPLEVGSGGPNGPHGSRYPHILIARYDMPFLGASRDPYNNNLYSLCFRCHSADYVMSSGSAFVGLAVNLHQFHVRDNQIPCFACHDPHGAPFQRGATAANNAHLINFDKGYAVGAAVANPVYLSSGPGSGSCTVNCHTVAGNTHDYGSVLGRRLFNKRPFPVKLR